MSKLLGYLFKGGIQGKFFVKSQPVKQESLQLYEVKGYAGPYNSTPRTICVDICDYNLKSGEVYRYNQLLVNLIQDEEATEEQIESIPLELRKRAKKLPKSKDEPYIPF